MRIPLGSGKPHACRLGGAPRAACAQALRGAVARWSQPCDATDMCCALRARAGRSGYGRAHRHPSSDARRPLRRWSIQLLSKAKGRHVENGCVGGDMLRQHRLDIEFLSSVESRSPHKIIYIGFKIKKDKISFSNWMFSKKRQNLADGCSKKTKSSISTPRRARAHRAGPRPAQRQGVHTARGPVRHSGRGSGMRRLRMRHGHAWPASAQSVASRVPRRDHRAAEARSREGERKPCP